MEHIYSLNDDGNNITLLASRSREGGKGIFPRIPAESPVAELYEDIELGCGAILYSYTVIHPNPKTGKPPFVLALADFGGCARVFGQLEHPVDQVTIGMPLVARATSAEGDGRTDYHFVLAREN